MISQIKCELERFKGRIISMSCTMTLIGETRKDRNKVLLIPTESLSMLEDSREDIGHFLGLDPRRNGTNPCQQLDGEVEKTAEGMMLHFAESGHLVFRASSALENGRLEKAKKQEWNPSTWTVVMTPLNWFFAQLFPSISSVSTEQYQFCEKN